MQRSIRKVSRLLLDQRKFCFPLCSFSSGSSKKPEKIERKKYSIEGFDAQTGATLISSIEATDADQALQNVQKMGYEIRAMRLEDGKPSKLFANNTQSSSSLSSSSSPPPPSSSSSSSSSSSRSRPIHNSRSSSSSSASLSSSSSSSSLSSGSIGGPSRNDEVLEWEGHPSHWLNFHYYLLPSTWIPFDLFLTLDQLGGGQWTGQDLNTWLLQAGLHLQVEHVTHSMSGLFVALAGWQYLSLKATKFKLTNQRLIQDQGALARSMRFVELYRIKDYSSTTSVIQRILGLGTVTFRTSDRNMPQIKIRNIPNHRELLEIIRILTEANRDRKGVKEIDGFDHGSDHHGDAF